ncbi:DsbC family protein [Undibacterium oligocarboniphilum]|uniref:Thiol:disulfide interchange protein n=1 Tax=Undibacterium oligocarboniphilum TaxID=666702 RepID=A0A850Q7M0_9BURK|nr:DsbC family protein [Undibacterium oligocarboniphilum]MBC3871155.1 DsbC family protein [Undibacterium oligocarboniphilum]NVO76222.1 DsbC family protein [Undibacterium oligocarboniphilum]
MKLKHYIVAMSAAVMLVGTGLTIAQTPQETAVKKLVEPRLADGIKVDSVTKTPYAGLYEVRVGSEVLYTDEKAQYLFIGNVIDAKNGVNYTKARTDDLSRVKFSDLPLESALKMVKGDGKRVIAVFEDPNCGYCKRLRKTLAGMDNITVYTFMYNILSEDSAVKSKNIWCSADRNKAWEDWMLNGKAAAPAQSNCVTPNDKILALGQKLRVNGTPAIFFADGSRVPGALDAKGLEEKFASLHNVKVN